MKMLRNLAFAGTLAAVAAVGIVAPAQAQRDPAYSAARSAGQVGERNNGYLGVVGQETPALRRLVNDINIKRKAVYTRRAQTEGATVEQYAKAAACQAIARTVPGEKYQAPDGSWQTRTSAAPLRDPACT